MAATLTVQDLQAIDKLMEAHLKEPMRRIEEHHATLYGNGQPGLKENVSVLLNAEKSRQKWKFLVVGAFVSAFALLVLDAGMHLLQSMPHK